MGYRHRPDLASQAYTLRASFPPKPLPDESVSVAQAGLANSVVLLN